jgi:ArsR family transcriptional regulator, arsenate/arsenite/antimonite-responsive transcriptional repressor / arsenate reductase (thioredoxin)
MVALTGQNCSVMIEAMDIEANLEHRAALHATLGDPARLRIVDVLAVGDASPSDLAAATGLGSNLLAHHLGVLERHGLIERTRSEGDRRRTYVRLVEDPLNAMARLGPTPPTRVLFVCTANSARSHLAAALWRRASKVPADSAGTHPARRIDPRAVAAAARHNLPLRRSRPRRLADVRNRGDLIVTVCDQAREELMRASELRDTALHWSVADPVPLDTAAAFEQAFQEISHRVDRLATAMSATAAGRED